MMDRFEKLEINKCYNTIAVNGWVMLPAHANSLTISLLSQPHLKHPYNNASYNIIFIRGVGVIYTNQHLISNRKGNKCQPFHFPRIAQQFARMFIAMMVSNSK